MLRIAGVWRGAQSERSHPATGTVGSFSWRGLTRLDSTKEPRGKYALLASPDNQTAFQSSPGGGPGAKGASSLAEELSITSLSNYLKLSNKVKEKMQKPEK